MSAATTTHTTDASVPAGVGPNTPTAFEMKAITRERFGGPDVLQLDDIEWPRVGADEVLVQVHAAGVNQGDVLELHGWRPYLGRLMGYGLRRPKRLVPGTDIVGRVVAVGARVSGVDVDDEVVGWGAGAFAEFATAPANMVIGRPPAVPAEQAAAVPTGGVAALQAVRRAGRVKPGQHVLVIGAPGGVGTLVVVGGQNPRTLTGMRRFAAAGATSLFARQRIVPLLSKPDRDDLAVLVELVSEGAVRPIVGATFDLTDTATAFHRVESGHASGKVVITV